MTRGGTWSRRLEGACLAVEQRHVAILAVLFLVSLVLLGVHLNDMLLWSHNVRSLPLSVAR